MLVYSALYTAHFIFDTLYDAQPIWTVLNIVSAAGILIVLAVNFAHMRAQLSQQAVTMSRLGHTPSSTPTPPWPSGSSATGSTCSPWRRANRSASTRTSSGWSSPS